MAKNRHLVDNSSVCVAYLTRSGGGTAYTVEYAKKHGLKVINIAANLKKAQNVPEPQAARGLLYIIIYFCD